MILKIPKQGFIIVRLTKLKKGYQDLVYQGNLLLYFINHSSIMRNLLIFKAMIHILSKIKAKTNHFYPKVKAKINLFYPKVKAIRIIIALSDILF